MGRRTKDGLRVLDHPTRGRYVNLADLLHRVDRLLDRTVPLSPEYLTVDRLRTELADVRGSGTADTYRGPGA